MELLDIEVHFHFDEVVHVRIGWNAGVDVVTGNAAEELEVPADIADDAGRRSGRGGRVAIEHFDAAAGAGHKHVAAEHGAGAPAGWSRVEEPIHD